jgi:hypothetical protein
VPGHEERPDPDVVTAVTRSADPLREGRGLLLDLVDRAEVRDAVADRNGQHRHRPHGPGACRRALLIRPDGCVAWALPTGQDLDDATTLLRALGTGSANRPERRFNSRLRFAR